MREGGPGSHQEVEEKSQKAPGLDDIPIELLKEVDDSVAVITVCRRHAILCGSREYGQRIGRDQLSQHL